MAEPEDNLNNSSDEDITSTIPSIEDLTTWTVKKLKAWLEEHGLKRSGCKDILVKRVYRAHQSLLDSDSENDLDQKDTENPRIEFNKLDSSWSTVTDESLPDIADKDIENYYLYQTNPTSGKRAKFQRHLKKARKFSAENFLKDIKYHAVSDISDVCYIKAKCNPSMRSVVHVGNTGKTSSEYSLYVCMTKTTGHIMSAYCNCKAGEAGLCAHVGGLLFSLLKMKNACTSQECRWDRPRPISRKPSPKRLCEVRFSSTSSETVTEKSRPFPDTFQASASKDPDSFLRDLLKGMDMINPGCVLFKTLNSEPADISSFLDNFKTHFMYADCVNLKSQECTTLFHNFVDNLHLSSTIVENLEIGTRGQAINNNWIEARKVLITASNMGAVCKRIKFEPDNLVSTLRGYNPPPSTLKSLQHGRKYERQALKDYKISHAKSCCGNIELEDRGLVVNTKYPFLGASVDGIITCSNCGTGVVEVKCPYGSENSTQPFRNIVPLECAQNKSFFCALEADKLKLKQNHNYMFQVQGQMAICEKSWTDFVVWTKKGISIERILFQKTFWEEKMYMIMYMILKEFYIFGMIPEFYVMYNISSLLE